MIYFVSTPIGNLKDITLRAIETLKNVDVIACEDTRTSLKLLSHYEIDKKLVSYHKFNEATSAKGIIQMHQEGKDVAVISDSGTPLISDPGAVLVNTLREQKIPYTVIPGANALLPALVLSGLDSSRFTFVGFLPEKKKDQQVLLQKVKNYQTTLIFYLSPHDRDKNLNTMFEELGNRRAVLVNEITKMYEKTEAFMLGEAVKMDARGEFVLVVEGAQNEESEISQEEIGKKLQILLNNGMSSKGATKVLCELFDLPKNKVYELTKFLEK